MSLSLPWLFEEECIGDYPPVPETERDNGELQQRDCEVGLWLQLVLVFACSSEWRYLKYIGPGSWFHGFVFTKSVPGP